MDLDSSIYAENVSPMLSHINVGYGEDMSIGQLAQLVASTVGYTGAIEFDTTKADGTPRKLMDSGRLNKMGWKAEVNIEQGLALAYSDFLERLSVKSL